MSYAQPAGDGSGGDRQTDAPGVRSDTAFAGLVASGSQIEQFRVDTIQKSTTDEKTLLAEESMAYRMSDPMNCSATYIVKKSHSKMASMKGKRSVLMVLNKDGMPAVVMAIPMMIFRAYEKIRGKTKEEIQLMHMEFLKQGKTLASWGEAFSPRETTAKMVEASKVYPLIYCDQVAQDKAKPGILRLEFSRNAEGQCVRKPKAFEIRPEPYDKDEAAIQCEELVTILRCGMVNSYLQKPMLVDRPIKESATRAWLEGLKPHINCLTKYGKSNLHQQVQSEGRTQIKKIQELLSWGADPNIPFGPTSMTALHMAASWEKPNITHELLGAGADPMAVDVNGMTPLHLACVFGDAGSVQELLRTGKCDLNQVASTPFGSMRPLDCALECNKQISVKIWSYLKDKGAETNYRRKLQLYAAPYPLQEVSPLMALLMSLHRSGHQESDVDFRKVQMLLADGLPANELDIFGRSLLCYTSTGQMSQLLLRNGADPAHAAGQRAMQQYAFNYVGATYCNTLPTTLSRLKALAFLPGDQRANIDSTSPQMAQIVVEFTESLKLAYRQAYCSTSPLADAMACGKVMKARALIDHGVSPCMLIPTSGEQVVDFRKFVDPSSDHTAQLQDRFGPAVWGGIAEKLLVVALKMACPPMKGSFMLATKAVKRQAEADQKEAMLEAMTEAITRQENEVGQDYTSLRFDDVRTSEEELQRTTRECAACLEALPKADTRALTFDNQEKAELAAAAGITLEENLLKKRAAASGKVSTSEGWDNYRTRTMSFKRTTSASTTDNFE